MTSFDKQLKKLRASLLKLDGTSDRPIARRNARKRVLGALRSIRGAVDTLYPAIVSREGTKRLTPEGRLKRLRRDWISISSGQAGPYAACGIPVKRIMEGGANDGTEPFPVFYVPRWAHHIGYDAPSKLKRAKKDIVYRRALLVEIALRDNSGTQAA